jgi:hypothetical protein
MYLDGSTKPTETPLSQDEFGHLIHLAVKEVWQVFYTGGRDIASI